MDGLDVTKSLRSDRGYSDPAHGHGSMRCDGASAGARGASLARIWFFARLPVARTNRMGKGAESRPGLLVWRSRLLSRALDRWRLRPMLDTDADWKCVELRSIVGSRPHPHIAKENRPQWGTPRPVWFWIVGYICNSAGNRSQLAASHHRESAAAKISRRPGRGVSASRRASGPGAEPDSTRPPRRSSRCTHRDSHIRRSHKVRIGRDPNRDPSPLP